VSATPNPLAFGSVTTGTSGTKTVTLRNTGATTWTSTGATSSNAAVKVTRQPCATLAPGASCTATVAFAPAAGGPVSAAVHFTGANGTASLTVTGTGVVPHPVVTQISPNHGPKHGGTVVTITGTHFTGMTSIRSGTTVLHAAYCSSSTRCYVLMPAGTGTKDIRVVTAGGYSAVVSADRFTYRG
jgi:hypothetical protein